MNRPILFSGPMVKAILAGSKTMTRRLPNARVRQKWNDYAAWVKAGETGEAPPVRNPLNEHDFYAQYPPYHIGDMLWVRETWLDLPYGYVYRADYNQGDGEEPEGWDCDDRWRPSIFMPKEACRIFLRVTDVRLERLNEITNEDARKEGFSGTTEIQTFSDEGAGSGYLNSKEEFALLWDSLRNPAGLDRYGWAANPWVWVISFERCEKPEGFLP